MHEGWVFLSFPKPRHKSSSHIKEPEPTQPDFLLSFNKYFNVNDSDQGVLSHIRKRPQEEGVFLSCHLSRIWDSEGADCSKGKQGRRLFHVP